MLGLEADDVLAVLQAREASALDFGSVAQLQDFLSARIWRPYYVTLPAVYTGIELKLSSRSGRPMTISVFQHDVSGSLFISAGADLFVSPLSPAEMVRFLEIVGIEKP